MAGSVNKVILVGNVGRDPEIRSTQSGQKIANLTLATSESWKDKNTRERQERTEWHRVVIFGNALAEIVERYVKKGSKLYIEGSLQTRKWTDRDGNERYTTEVVLQPFSGQLTMLDTRAGSGGGDYGQGGYGGGAMNEDNPMQSDRSNNASNDYGSFGNAGSGLDDDIPF